MEKFRLQGTVKPFAGDGRKLGYPTANIEVNNDIAEGLFVGYVKLLNKKLPALIFIGAPITFGDSMKRAEAHILDFEDKDLYGESLEFIVTSKMRDNKKFNSKEELIKQMKQDEQDARNYFKKLSKGN